MSPGSMPLSTELFQEGIIIPPIKLVAGGEVNEAALSLIVRNSRTPEERHGDLAAQQASHTVGERRLREIIDRYGLNEVNQQAGALIAYASRLTAAMLSEFPTGTYEAEDVLDNDGITALAIPIRITLTLRDGGLTADFSGSSPAVAGSVNAVAAIVHSAVGYVVRCIVGESLPMNHGVFEPLKIIVPPGSVLDPGPPHAVAGGNVETSMRIVDVLYKALAQALPDRIPAASQGTMNNLTFGGIHPATGDSFAYYETIGGGSGAGPGADGASAIHCHMSNTLNTPIEALELAFPVRVVRYGRRRGSGGEGAHRGGDGIERELEFLAPAVITILSERRQKPPYGLSGGEPGACGENRLRRVGSAADELLPGKVSCRVEPGDILRIHTPGGGGWGQP
jgi:N-methylhydantoinase B